MPSSKNDYLKSTPANTPTITPEPPSNNDQAKPTESPLENLLDPVQLFMEITNVETPPDSSSWPHNVSLMNLFSDDLVEPQPDPDIEPPLRSDSKELTGSLDFSYILSPSLDILNIPDELKFIMQYHICEVVPKLCVDNLSPQNPYREYVLPLAIEEPSLLYACAALAACHFNVRLSTNQFEKEFFRFKGKAIKRLQENLYSPIRAKHPGTLATILMLCLCDLCHGEVSDFQSHFHGARKLIELRQERTTGCFVEQYLAW
ncbi:hypothetical protein N7462_004342 [Penicillium macrosclerotiorum]|uniref:uncharacterized protein n=1 Tax=Penicillium macrosclerotiorum TaxID=303699 RepID=UPI002548BF2D|nr:uncharacterized protein N7462_004342 [Penicillium macrosclerotiorum]KAJ5689950.1 hypothetical protein N7462_004342 [Penicillium macrosclerotiorum]